MKTTGPCFYTDGNVSWWALLGDGRDSLPSGDGLLERKGARSLGYIGLAKHGLSAQKYLGKYVLLSVSMFLRYVYSLDLSRYMIHSALQFGL